MTRVALAFASVCLLAPVAGAEDGPRTVFIEAETMDGIGKADGWYTVWNFWRSGGASAHIKAASIEKGVNVTLEKTLAEPLPPGNHRVLIDVFWPNFDGGGAMDITLGKVTQRFEWPLKKRPRWMEKPFVLTEPARSVKATAIRADGAGEGDPSDPENRVNKVMFDMMCITTDPRVRIVEERSGHNRLVAPDERVAAYSSRVELPPEMQTGRKREARVGKGNLVLNSSFEVDNAPGWGGIYQHSAILSDYISRENPRHGRFCLQLDKAHPVSRTIALRINDGATHTLSFWARGAGRIEAHVMQDHEKPAAPAARFDLASEWRRFQTAGTVAAGLDGKVHIGFWHDRNSDEKLFIDQVMFAEGESAEWQPAASVEVGIQRGVQFAEMYTRGGKAEAVLLARAEQPASARVDVVIENAEGARLVSRSEEIVVGSEKHSQKNIPLYAEKCGYYRLILSVDGRFVDEYVYMVLPARRSDYALDKSYIGGDWNYQDGRKNRILKRIYFDWVKDFFGGRWGLVQTGKDEWQFPDDKIKQAKADGLGVVMVLFNPRWLKIKAFEGGAFVEPGQSKDWMREEWRRYCSTYAQHFRGKIGLYECWNEPFYDMRPPKYAELMRICVDAVKAADPAARVLALGGGNANWALEVEKCFGDEEKKKYFAAASFHYYGEEVDDMKRTAGWLEKIGSQALNTERGTGAFPMYRTHANSRITGLDVAEESFQEQVTGGIRESLLGLRAGLFDFTYGRMSRVLFHLTRQGGRPDETLTHWSGVGFDGLPHPVSVAFGMLGHMINGYDYHAACAADTPLHAFVFGQSGGRNAVAPVFAKNREPLYLTLPARDELSVHDLWTNPVEPIRKDRAGQVYLVDELPRYVVARGLDAAEFHGLLSREMKVAAAHPLAVKFAFDKRDTIRVALGNQTAEPFTGSASFTEYGVSFFGGQEPAQRVVVKPGQTAFLDFPLTALSERLPLKLEVAGHGVKIKHVLPLRLLSAKQTARPVACDGKLNEWSQARESRLQQLAVTGKFEGTEIRSGLNVHFTYDDLGGKFLSQWDEQNFYFAARVIDESVQLTDGFEPGRGDQVHLYFDGDIWSDPFGRTPLPDDRHLILALNPDGVVNMAVAQHGAYADPLPVGRGRTLAQQGEEPGGYLIEVAIPWKTLGVTPRIRQDFGLDISLWDADGTLEQVEEMVWAGAATPPGDPTGFGQLVLTE